MYLSLGTTGLESPMKGMFLMKCDYFQKPLEHFFLTVVDDVAIHIILHISALLKA
jgi:hypothetical protein